MLLVTLPMLLVTLSMLLVTLSMLLVTLSMLLVTLPMLLVTLPMLLVTLPMLLVTLPMLMTTHLCHALSSVKCERDAAAYWHCTFWALARSCAARATIYITCQVSVIRINTKSCNMHKSWQHTQLMLEQEKCVISVVYIGNKDRQANNLRDQ